MPVPEHIAQVIKINNYLEEFLPTMLGGNATKLPDNELLDLLDFGTPTKWQQQMQVQNFKPTAKTLQDFQDFCKHLDSALDNQVTDNKSNKMSREKNNKKIHRNNKNNKGKRTFACCLGITLRTAPNSAIP